MAMYCSFAPWIMDELQRAEQDALKVAQYKSLTYLG